MTNTKKWLNNSPSVSFYARLRKSILSTAISLLLLTFQANADTVTLVPTASGYAADGGSAGNWVIDGVYDSLGTASDVFIRKYRSLDFTQYVEFRGAYEYTLPPVLSSPGVKINSVSLILHSSYASFWIGDYINTYGYVADGVIDLADFDNTNAYAGNVLLSGGSGNYNRDHIIDVTDYVVLVASSNATIGFVTAVSWWGVYVTLNPTAELQIDYDIVTADGDINQDEFVNVVDILLAQRIALGEMPPDDIQLLRGDVAPLGAPDGQIDTADLLLITRKALGMTSEF